MSESREYYSRSEQYGDVYISEEVLEMIAGAAALEVDGVTASHWHRRVYRECSGHRGRRHDERTDPGPEEAL